MLYRGVPDKEYLPASTLERSALTNAAGQILVHATVGIVAFTHPELFEFGHFVSLESD